MSNSIEFELSAIFGTYLDPDIHLNPKAYEVANLQNVLN
jgi:hypothetical protein